VRMRLCVFITAGPITKLRGGETDSNVWRNRKTNLFSSDLEASENIKDKQSNHLEAMECYEERSNKQKHPYTPNKQNHPYTPNKQNRQTAIAFTLH
jgi:hypothetical protein